jgi:hypothetical protein
MIRLSRLFAFVLVCCFCSFALADSGGAPPDPWAPLFALLAVGCGSVGALVRTYTPTSGFWQGWWGHILLMLIGALLGSLGPMFEAGILTKVTLISALCGGAASFLAAWKTGFKQAQSSAAALLPLLFLFGAISGCHGYKAPTYATLALMDQGAAAAAQAIPPACELFENAAVDAAKAKGEATTAVAAIHDRCSAALTVLEGIGKGVKTARASVHDAPDGTLPPDALSWIALLAKQYCDAVPLLAFFHVTLPIPAGAC